MKLEALSDVGKVREMNQDYFKIHRFSDNSALILVCDGMGGALAGNVASEVAVNSAYERFMKLIKENMNTEDIKSMMISAVNCANLDVFDMAQNNKDYYGMGTTIVAIYINDGYAYTAHAGDSRAYIICENELKQITTDHSIVQHLIEQKVITPEEAKHHPKRNVITRALGVDEFLEIDFSATKLECDDIVLVCTDGLTNYVSDDIIFETLKQSEPKEAIEKLIADANENGGGDNITIAVAAEF